MYMFQFFMFIGFILHELRNPQPLGELAAIGIMVIAIGSVAVTGIAAIVVHLS